jgi:hypothetical protein
MAETIFTGEVKYKRETSVGRREAQTVIGLIGIV